MARLNENPIKSPLTGNEGFAATDPATGTDVGLTPITITQFAQQNMSLAAGSAQGLMSGAQAVKLNGLPSPASLASQLAQLGEVSFPIFISKPADGTIVLYQHVLDVPWVIQFAYAIMGAGSTNVSIQKGFTPIAGMTNVPVTGVSSTITSTDTPPNNTFNSTNALSLQFSGTTGDAADLTLSLKFISTLTP
jgi:hypothetical protein